MLYACQNCREHLQIVLEEKVVQIDYTNTFTLQKTLCELHNDVNEILGKPLFPCDIETLTKRWKNGGERCNSKK